MARDRLGSVGMGKSALASRIYCIAVSLADRSASKVNVGKTRIQFVH